MPNFCSECGCEKKNKTARGLCKTCRNREDGRRYRASHREQFRAHGLKWYYANKDYVKAYHAARYATKDNTAEKARTKAWLAAHPEHVKARSAAYHVANRERRSAQIAEWQRTHRVEKNAAGHRRRARSRALPHTLTVEQWKAIVAAYKGRCAYCGVKTERLTQDHVIPVVKGGGYTADNIVPACLTCNDKKFVGPPPKPVQTMLL